MSRELITISLDHYNELVEDSDFLLILRNLGVDNWVGWEEACELMHGEEEVSSEMLDEFDEALDRMKTEKENKVE